MAMTWRRSVGLALALGLLVAPAFAADRPAPPAKPRHVPLPAAPGTTSQSLDGRTIIRTPGEPPKIVVPTNRGDAGKSDVQCQKVGTTYRCK